MEFWNLAYNKKWVDAQELRLVVITDLNNSGEITESQYKEITGVDFAPQ